MQEENPNTDSTPIPTSVFSKQQTIKAVFFDIDGTLISFKTRTIPESTTWAIQKLQEQGIRVIVATGRSIQAITPIRHLNFDGYVTFNGSACYDKDGNQLSRTTISPESITRLLYYTENRELNFVLMYEEAVAVNIMTPEILASHTRLKLPVPPVLDRTDPDVDNVLQANIFIGPEEEQEFMETIMPDCIAARWTPLFADVNPDGISKQVGVELFCKYFDIDASETMAFGDGGNDITMLQYAGIGVAMGNAGAEVKAAADYITTEADEDGILGALEYFGMID